MSDVNPLVGAGAARQDRCQQVKENLQVKQVTVADVDVRVIICHKPSACFGLAAFTYLLALFSVHPPSDPDHNREFALDAKTASYRLATSLQVFALIPLILGMFALYATIAHTRAARWAITGLIATVLDVTALARVGAAVGIAASVALAIDVSRHARVA